MHKLLAVTIIFLFMNRLTAQDLTSKNGESIMPEAGDWSLGLDATKFIKNANFDFLSSAQTISGKYMKTATSAIRAGVRIGVNTWTTKNLVEDRLARTSTVVAYPAAIPMKQNSWHRTATSIGLSGGYEKRRGKTRLQGVYGVEGGIYFSASTDKFSYGNALNASPLSPIFVDTQDDAMSSPILGNGNNIDTAAKIQGVINNTARVLERKNGVLFGLGLRAFIGAEYFFLPKMSLGGEFGWGMSYITTGRSQTRVESRGQSNIQGQSASVKQTTIESAGSDAFHLDTDNSNVLGGASATLRLNLYF